LVIAGVACLTEGDHASLDHLLHGLTSRLQIIARIEVFRLLSKHLPNCAGYCHTTVGVDVDFPNAVADTPLDFFYWYAEGRLDLAAVLVDGVL